MSLHPIVARGKLQYFGNVAYATGREEMSQKTGTGDLRTRRTRAALRDALLALIEEKGFEAIVVQDLADRALINRVTFYRHYRDKYELLEQTMQEMLGELGAGLEALLHVPGDRAVYAGLVAWLEQVSRHASFYRAMLGRRGNAAFAAELRDQLEALVTRLFRAEHRVVPPLAYAVRLRFAGAGFLGVTEWWLEQERPAPVREVATQLQWLLKRVVLNPTEE